MEASLGGVKAGDSYPVRLVGVINLSPESFYQGSVRTNLNTVVDTATEMVETGADIIDVGAMSTAPYLRTEISIDEEINRIIPAVKALKKSLTVPISVDTKRYETAQAAVEAGADILNDVSGFKSDQRLAELAARAGLSAVVVANEPKPRAGDGIERIIVAVRESLSIAEETGIPRGKIVVDPGLGFFRNPDIPWYEWDCEVLGRIGELCILDRPIYLAISRKSFIGKILGQPDPKDRLIGSLSATAIAVFNGVHVIRTHDVRETIQTIRIAEAIRNLGKQ